MRSKSKRVQEKTPAGEAHDFALIRGWMTFKVESPTFNGLPDRLYLRRGRYVWIEWKNPHDGTLSAIQIIRIRALREHGAEVFVCTTIEEAKVILK